MPDIPHLSSPSVLTTLAVSNYRSLLDLIVPLGPVNLVTGANGSGKSNLYRALRLLAESGRDGVVSALAREGGLQSTFWAGPESLSAGMRNGSVPIQGTRRSEPMRLRLGFAGDGFGYAVSLGMPAPSAMTEFSLDPEVKRESVWAGEFYRVASALVDRKGPMIRVRRGKEWHVVGQGVSTFDTLFSQVADPEAAPEVFRMREIIRGWRFYDHFRTDREAPARQPQIGTRTPVLHHDGRDLAAALQTIREIGDGETLHKVVDDAFPGAKVEVVVKEGRFSLEFHQEGLLRPLSAAELSDGTLRYLLWIAALMTPRPPALMVLNEPETSLHPDLLPALGRLVIEASKRSQIWVVSHAARLVRSLEEHPECHSIRLEKEFGETRIEGLAPLDRPAWHWPEE
ncbi:MAG TPA: AAA family ATPase [Usitatibacter sp.]|nr:AAA family ATPase [Usitatibacter sp.]